VLERHGRPVVVLWLLVVAVSVPLALRQSEDLTGSGFDVPGSGSNEVRRAVERDFPDADQAQLAAVLVAQDDARPGELTAAVDRLETELASVPTVRVPAGAKELGLRTAASGVVVVSLSARIGEEQAPDVASHVRDALDVGEPRDGVVTHVIGLGAFVDATADVLEEDLASAEAIGFPAVLIVLLAVFGSLAAAALPLGLAIVSVTVTGALIFAVSQVMDVYIVATNLASLVGVGVAVDYSLFVLVRYREEVRAGHDPETARARALATSGVAVVFSGATVIASLAAIWTVDSSALRSLALGAILVVAVSVLAATTLLLPILRLLGRFAWEPGRLRSLLGRGERPTSFWSSWTERVTRRPGRALALSALLLVGLALPALSLDMRSGVLGQLPRDHEARVGFAHAARVLGPGVVGQTRLLVSFPEGDAAETASRTARLRRQLARDPAVADVGPPQLSADGRSALLAVTPRHASDSPVAKAAVERWRRDLPAAVAPGTVAVGGASAAQLDYEDQIRGSMWRILLFVLLVCYAVLVVLLRSLVVPLKAVLVNLLSVGAAYGVIVVVFQWGWLDGLIGYDSPGIVDPTVPPIVLALVFGLSMDYEVFLLSRVRERFELTGDSRRAVADGLASSAATITSAAAIMVAVFASFIATGIPAIQMIALGGAVAIALDATLVRLVLVPATMTLLGDRNWWLPERLSRLLPSSFHRLPEG
jgi:RND superfamily putative drug exporter